MNVKAKENVVILGASDKPDRYAYKAFKMLTEKGHNVFLVHPMLQEIQGHKVYKNLADIKEKIDTITVYVNSSVSANLESEILNLKPTRIIFNPGAENLELTEKLKSNNINVENACTLVLLSTNQY